MPVAGCSKQANLNLLDSKLFRIGPQPANGEVDIGNGLRILGGGGMRKTIAITTTPLAASA